ncbi:UNVERIFIED_ORG: hypothetical protein ABIB52_002323 [Arthrobacter sp. UYCu721]
MATPSDLLGALGDLFGRGGTPPAVRILGYRSTLERPSPSGPIRLNCHRPPSWTSAGPTPYSCIGGSQKRSCSFHAARSATGPLRQQFVGRAYRFSHTERRNRTRPRASPYLGSFSEVNVRLYSREPDGTRAVVFLSLGTNRLPVVLAARAAEIPYVWSRIRYSQPRPDSPDVEAAGYSVRRLRQGARSSFAVVPQSDATVDDPLSFFLTATFGIHGTFRGRSASGPPESVL